MFKEYEEKLFRRNARIIALWKWRFVFLGVFLLLVVLSVLLGMTGSVTNSAAAESYEYGDPIAPAGSALFSDVSFRYRAADGDWTDEVPVHAGDYEMQAVSRGLAGKPRYGEVRSFTITPAPITVKITDAEVDFGNLPQSVTADNLKYDDELVFGDFEVVYHDRTADITPVKDGLRIFDENKNDVTFDYHIAVQTKTIICNPIGATVATPDGSWVYDGKEHGAGEITAEGLLPGHTVGDISTSSVQNVGSYENEVDCRIFDEDGNDVTVHYVVEKRLGTLTVTVRPVTVTTVGLSAEYDGTEHILSNEPMGNLAQGHKFGYSPSTVSLEAVGTIENKVVFTIKDAKGKDVTHNYTVTEKFGTLTVTARPVTVTTVGQRVVYDGAEHTLSNEPKGDLVPGHVFGYQSKTITLKTVGEMKNGVEFVIKDAEGQDVTGNYSVTRQFGTLEITKRPLTIITGSASKMYDGKPLSYTAFNDKDSVKIEGLADGERVSYPLGMVNITDVGSIPNTFYGYWGIYAGDDNTASNYDIDEQWGTLTVEPYVIYLQSEDVDAVYDGKKHGRKNGTSLNEPVSGHVLRLTNWAQRTDAGSEPNIPGTIKVEAGGVDVTHNYLFDTEQCGTLTVNKRVLEVTTGSGEFVFDGTLKYVHDYTRPAALLGEHRISSYDTTKVMDVTDHDGQIGYVDNMIEFFIIKEKYSGRDVSGNYAVEPKDGTWGKIRVKAPIVVRLFSLSKVYDGTELAYKPTDWRVESLPVDIEKDWLKIDLVGNLTKVGTLEAAAVREQSHVELIDGSGEDLLPANRVDFVGEPLTVLARPLTVSSASARMSREGEILYGNNIPHSAWISSDTLLEGHSVKFTVTGSLKPDQTSALNAVVVHIFDGDTDVTGCYEIQYRYGTLSWL